jgi:hypothetical protein
VLVDLQKLAYGGAGEEGRCAVIRVFGPVAHVEHLAHQLVFLELLLVGEPHSLCSSNFKMIETAGFYEKKLRASVSEVW